MKIQALGCRATTRYSTTGGTNLVLVSVLEWQNKATEKSMNLRYDIQLCTFDQNWLILFGIQRPKRFTVVTITTTEYALDSGTTTMGVGRIFATMGVGRIFSRAAIVDFFQWVAEIIFF